jgi:hypothetical protein
MIEEISAWEAIDEMRKITADGGSFAFVHGTYNRDTMKTDGIREVKKAKLRPAASNDEVDNADYKLFYIDLYNHENRTAWQVLLMFFNGKKVYLP